MHATDIVGWIVDGAVYCNGHRPEGDETRPMFASDEGWADVVCDCPHNEPDEPIRFETLGEIIGIYPQGRPAQIYDDEPGNDDYDDHDD